MHDTTNIHSNYKQLGKYIRVIDERNKKHEVELLLGVSVKKVFIPSIANTVGTDFKKYKIVKRKQFTYIPDTSRRGDKMGLAMLEDHDIALVSQAYTVFEVIDHNELNPEYLMMWFRRPEFDRYARFKSHGSVREIFDWDEMCETELPIPSIEKQQEIVKEYNTIVNRIKLNEQLNQKLEETAQALYKHWFVDFEFPNADGKPYKSSGGTMVYNAELDKEIPEGWEVENLNSLCTKITKGTTPKVMSEYKTTEKFIAYLKGESISSSHHIELDKLLFIDKQTDNQLFRSQLQLNDIVHGMAGSISSLEKFALIDEELLPANTNQAIAIIRVNQKKYSLNYVYGYFISGLPKEYYKTNIQQAVQANLSLATISSLPVIMPDLRTIISIDGIMKMWIMKRNLITRNLRRLLEMESLFLSKMTKVETEKEVS